MRVRFGRMSFMGSGENRDWPWPVLCLCLLALVMYGVRLAGPPDLMHKAQHRTTAYTMDIVYNDQWIVQRDATGQIMSKPPLYNWITALLSLPLDRVTRLTMTLPAMGSVLGISLLVFATAQRMYDGRAAILSGLAVLLTPIGMRQVAIARPDALFGLIICAMALLAWRSWERGRGWSAFWLLAAAGILTKGPLCLLLAGGGLLAVLWERKATDQRPLRGHHWRGLLACLAISGAWFALAYAQVGQELADKMLRDELVGQAVQKPTASFAAGFYKPLAYFLWDTMPWCIIMLLGVWRVLTSPSVDPAQRRFERFLVCWLTFGLLLFSLAAQKRADLLLPLIAPAALLSGREIAIRVSHLTPAGFSRMTTCAAAVLLSLMSYYFLNLDRSNDRIIETIACKEMADALASEVGDGFAFTYADAPLALQFYSGVMQREASVEQAVELLSSATPAFVVVQRARADVERLAGELGTDVWRVYHQAMPRGPDLFVLGNVPQLRPTSAFAAASGTLQISVEGLRLTQARYRRFVFEDQGEVTFRNTGQRDRILKVTHQSPAGTMNHVRKLAPGESWHLVLPEPPMSEFADAW